MDCFSHLGGDSCAFSLFNWPTPSRVPADTAALVSPLRGDSGVGGQLQTATGFSLLEPTQQGHTHNTFLYADSSQQGAVSS